MVALKVNFLTIIFLIQILSIIQSVISFPQPLFVNKMKTYSKQIIPVCMILFVF